jgi:ribosomal protein S18 acetylase RimI-like enzyme
MMMKILMVLLLLILIYNSFSIMTINMKIDYRNLKINDIDSCSILCAEVFEGPFEESSWYNPTAGIVRSKAINGHKLQLKERYEEKLKKGLNHAMFVAIDDDKNIDNFIDIKDGIVAFMEVGMLPSPIPIIKSWEGNDIETYNDVPYIGNLIVSPPSRRKRIAEKLIRIALKVTEKWGYEYLWLAVDIDNIKALNLYLKMGFEIVLDERDLISKPNRIARLYMKKSPSIIENNKIIE